ncbi:MAG: nicotinate-nucleotide--dimethylbenzimidazole phosphoribosyltransferase [Chloroflexota bacterium]|nr:nicotinate-nucleotide--dimethylbenzimidazole phosphoribosyltransferase [Chloroflexota bacterium]MDE2895601.1 nicotinate-nucleotide--dimethylbenzimidazole phosphoribosyltransferase [Chloroflexota bacterium]
MIMLDDILRIIEPLDREAMAAAERRQRQLTKPPGSLGRLEELSILLAGMQGDERPRAYRKQLILAAGDHGVASSGVSSYPQEVTAQMVQNFLEGGAAVNVFAQRAGVELTIVDAGVAVPVGPSDSLVSVRLGFGTENIAEGPAMSLEQAEAALDAGAKIARAAAAYDDVIGIGEMGIGNTTSAAAIVSVLCGRPPEAVTGRGASRSDEQLASKIAVVTRAIDVNQPDPTDGVDVLRTLGGFEIGVLAGVVLGAASRRTPVVLDGFITAAAALIAQAIVPLSRDYLIAGHRSAERGHGVALEHLGLKPLLELDMRLGEGTGAVLAMGIVDAAAASLNEMATFAEAGVSDSESSHNGGQVQ